MIVYNRRGKAIRHIASGIPVPCGVSISKYDEVCVGSSGGSGVHCYDTKGNEIYSDPSGKVCGLDFGPRGNLYTTRPDINTVTVHSLRPGTRGSGSLTPTPPRACPGAINAKEPPGRFAPPAASNEEDPVSVPMTRYEPPIHPTSKEKAMSIHVTTAILDLHQPLSEQHKRNLEATLKADAGVLSVGIPAICPGS